MLVALIVSFLALMPVSSQQVKPKAPVKHLVVVEFSSGSAPACVHVLGNVKNLLKAFKGDKTLVEVVCHDDGINLLRRNGTMTSSLASLHKSGVVFAACSNSMRGHHLSKKDILPFAVVVDSGIAEVVRKEESGFSYVRGPG